MSCKIARSWNLTYAAMLPLHTCFFLLWKGLQVCPQHAWASMGTTQEHPYAISVPVEIGALTSNRTGASLTSPCRRILQEWEAEN